MVYFLQFPHQNPACISLCLYACHMPHPPHPPLIDHPNIWGWVEIMKLYNFLQPLVPSYLLGPSMFLSTLFLNTLSPCYTLNVKTECNTHRVCIWVWSKVTVVSIITNGTTKGSWLDSPQGQEIFLFCEASKTVL
jgi:hypothetical protein